MLPRDESLYKRIKMQQVAERLITGTAQTTEHIITNNTGRSFLLLAQMQGGKWGYKREFATYLYRGALCLE